MGANVVRQTCISFLDLWEFTPDRLLGLEGSESARKRVLQNASVVCTTLLRAASSRMKDLYFDLVIVDEASQISEVNSWVRVEGYFFIS